jgi:hypothetical protein
MIFSNKRKDHVTRMGHKRENSRGPRGMRKPKRQLKGRAVVRAGRDRTRPGGTVERHTSSYELPPWTVTYSPFPPSQGDPR